MAIRRLDLPNPYYLGRRIKVNALNLAARPLETVMGRVPPNEVRVVGIE